MGKTGFWALSAALAAFTAAPAPAAPPRPAAAANWLNTVTRTPDDGYILGNPNAKVKLVAYVSFTCPHCAAFESEADAQLRIGMIAPGKGSLEFRPFLLNGLDVVVALLAECGPPSKFFGNAQMFFAKQREWTAPLNTLTDAQKARWDNPDFGAKMRAIAGDLGLYALMEARGYDRVALDRCLGDKALADRIAKHTQDAVDKDFVHGTPTFLLDGVPLTGTATWDVLKPQLEARLR
jgi:protein-disulfide isomerase